MRTAVVGLGWMGRVHLRIYSEMPGVEVVGVMDADPAKLDEVAKSLDVPTFSDLDELLACKPDAVSVCVPTSLHRDIGLRIIGAGSSLLVEKPLAATVEQGLELVEAAKEQGVQLMVGHVERFNPAVARVKSLAEEDAPISIQIERVGPYPPRIQDVGVIRDLGSHDIDLIRHISGSEYKRVFAVTSTTIGKHEDTALITAEMENGVLGQITTNWVTPDKSRYIRVATGNGYVEANLITQQVKQYSRFTTYDASYSVREWPVQYKEPVKEELTAFLSALRAGNPVPISGRDGLAVLETIEHIMRGVGN